MTDKHWENLLSTDQIDLIEKKRRLMSMLTMTVLGIVVVASLLVSNFDKYPTSLSLALVSLAISLIASGAFYCRTKNISLTGKIICFLLLLFNGLLMYLGGKEGTALYWILFYPLVAFSVLGLRSGTVYSCLFLVAATSLLYGPDIGQYHYPQTEGSRFLMSSFIIVVFSIINESYRDRSHSKIESISNIHNKNANTDALTQIPNRHFLESTYFPYLRSHSQEVEPVSLILADIDHFKTVNDTHGHAQGDKALIHAVDIFKGVLRQTDLLCRYGGEEFLICLPGIDQSKAALIAEKIRLALQDAPLVLETDTQLNMTCSFGVAEMNKDSSIEHSLKQADACLYQAKNNGRNKVVSLTS